MLRGARGLARRNAAPVGLVTKVQGTLMPYATAPALVTSSGIAKLEGRLHRIEHEAANPCPSNTHCARRRTFRCQRAWRVLSNRAANLRRSRQKKPLPPGQPVLCHKRLGSVYLLGVR